MSQCSSYANWVQCLEDLSPVPDSALANEHRGTLLNAYKSGCVSGRRLTLLTARALKQRPLSQDDPLLLTYLSTTPNLDLTLEHRLITLRKDWLKRLTLSSETDLSSTLTNDTAVSNADTAFLAALATQCYLNEYLWPVTDQESDTIAQRYSLLCNTPVESEHLLTLKTIILACYDPIEKVITRLERADHPCSLPTCLQDQLVKTQRRAALRDQFTPAATGAELPDSTCSSDSNQHVAQHYEQHPYPRWEVCDSPSPINLCDYLDQTVVGFDQAQESLPNVPEKILIIGCGTGLQTLQFALRFPRSHITAIDLSRTALAYAKERFEAFTSPQKRASVNFIQANFLALDSAWHDEFDLISCIGVLPHITGRTSAADLAWSKLVQILHPKGLCRIGLYSQQARAALIRAREKTRQSMTQEKNVIAVREALKRQNPALFAQWPDCFTRSECQDLLLHVDETTTTLPKVASMIDSHKLRLLGLECPDSSTRDRFLTQYGHTACTSLQAWHAFELENPRCFRNQYLIWVSPAL